MSILFAPLPLVSILIVIYVLWTHCPYCLFQHFAIIHIQMCNIALSALKESQSMLLPLPLVLTQHLQLGILTDGGVLVAC